MKKTVLTFGLISGLIVTTFMLISMAMNSKEHMNPDSAMIIGFASMLVAFSLIYVAVKSYRDKHNGGVISFGKALQIGLLITLIASTMYVLGWMVEYHFFLPDFMEKYSACIMEQAKASGASAAELQVKSAEMAYYKELYKSPLMVFLITYTEILPMGILVSLITALILKRKQAKV